MNQRMVLPDNGALGRSHGDPDCSRVPGTGPAITIWPAFERPLSTHAANDPVLRAGRVPPQAAGSNDEWWLHGRYDHGAELNGAWHDDARGRARPRRMARTGARGAFRASHLARGSSRDGSPARRRSSSRRPRGAGHQPRLRPRTTCATSRRPFAFIRERHTIRVHELWFRTCPRTASTRSGEVRACAGGSAYDRLGRGHDARPPGITCGPTANGGRAQAQRRKPPSHREDLPARA